MSGSEDHSRLWTAAALLGAAAIGLAAASFWPKREVLYGQNVQVFGCQAHAAGILCVAHVKLSVGNTGDVEQELVRIGWPIDARKWAVSWRVFDIRASAVSRPDPVISMSDEAGGSWYEIRRLAANTVVEFEGRCLLCPEQELLALRDARIAVQAAGTVAEGDPRVTTMLRGLMHVVRTVVPGL